jgi:DNA repair protein RecO (recombination protein O)
VRASAVPSAKATAIVIRVVEFSETSSVVTLFTREFGKVRALAKGARRPKGPFESALDLLAVCRIVFHPKSGDVLDLLTEAKLERRFRPRADQLAGLYAGCYVAELLSELTDDHDPHPQLFDMADRTLLELATGGGVASLILRFELSALRILGHFPSLDCCVGCGTRVESRGQVAFGSWEGGVLCPDCRPGKRHVLLVSARAFATLRRFSDLEAVEGRDEAVNDACLGELRGVLNHYVSGLVGRPLRMYKYLSLWARRS